MLALIIHDISSYFSSFIRVIGMALLVVILNVFLWVLPDSSILEYGFADLTMLFETLPYILIFLVPSITMNHIVDDFQQGRSELLFSKPIGIWTYLSSHFISTILICLVFLALTLTSYISIVQLKSEIGIIDGGQIWGAYLGMFLITIVFVGIGLMCSSISKSQAGAFLLSIIICYSVLVLPGYTSELGGFSGGLDYVLSYFSLDAHVDTLGRGLLEFRTIVYCMSLIAFTGLCSYITLRNKMV